jgi:F0F1-type ATP synthase membrane subunit b/b'
MKNQVAELSILVAERILKEKLGDATAQKALMDKVMSEADLRRS